MSTSFTPVSAVIGGVLIGLGILVLYHTLGRVAGVSGILGTALRRGTTGGERGWRVAFMAGLIAGPVIGSALTGTSLIQPSPASLPVLPLAGFLVGIGTGMANGCTSGHGVCGVSRLSRRSIAATVVFMGFGFLTASLGRHLFSG